MKKMIATLQNKMTSVFKNTRASKNLVKESGSGGPLVYAMCFVALFLCVYLFLWTDYKEKIYLLKDDMEMNLHIVENYCITVNQKTGTNDNFERERERAHIITVGANNPSASVASRRAQANEIGKSFSNQFKETFDLNNNKPNSGLLLLMSKDHTDMATMNIKEVKIYEPTYLAGTVYPVYCKNEKHSHTENCKIKPTATSVPSGFWSTTSTSEWYVYELQFDDNNNYTTCVVSKQTDAPLLYNGQPAEGATIEGTIVASFYQPDNFVLSGTKVTTVEVQEAIDIVYASDDSRQQ